jgi:membrane protein implicated in regulation of membrane protease activity
VINRDADRHQFEGAILLKTIRVLLSFLTLMFLAQSAAAYIGPGAGISVVGSLLGLLGTVLLAVGVIFLWPLRRLLKKKSAADDEEPENSKDAEVTEDTERVVDK